MNTANVLYVRGIYMTHVTYSNA